jgi:hypothetical protein
VHRAARWRGGEVARWRGGEEKARTVDDAGETLVRPAGDHRLTRPIRLRGRKPPRRQHRRTLRPRQRARGGAPLRCFASILGAPRRRLLVRPQLSIPELEQRQKRDSDSRPGQPRWPNDGDLRGNLQNANDREEISPTRLPERKDKGKEKQPAKASGRCGAAAPPPARAD